jgi:hypothetical protein
MAHASLATRREEDRALGVDNFVRVHLGRDPGRGRAASKQRALAANFPAPQVGRDGIDRNLIHGCTLPF